MSPVITRKRPKWSTAANTRGRKGSRKREAAQLHLQTTVVWKRLTHWSSKHSPRCSSKSSIKNITKKCIRRMKIMFCDILPYSWHSSVHASSEQTGAWHSDTSLRKDKFYWVQKCHKHTTTAFLSLLENWSGVCSSDRAKRRKSVEAISHISESILKDVT